MTIFKSILKLKKKTRKSVFNFTLITATTILIMFVLKLSTFINLFKYKKGGLEVLGSNFKEQPQ